MELNIIHNTDCLEGLKTLPDDCVQTCVTSPPYYNLRDYGHAGQIGLEETPEAYVQKLVQVFSEVKRVLKNDGTCWVNIGDSYSSQGGGQVVNTINSKRKGGSDSQNKGKSRNSSNLIDSFYAVNKFQSICFADAFSVRIASHSINIPTDNQIPKNQIFMSLFGVERIFIKKRNNDFCKVFNLFNSKGNACITGSFSSVIRDVTTLEIVFYETDNVSIIHSDLDTDLQAVFGINTFTSGVSVNTTFAIKESTKPIPESITYGQSIRYSITQSSLPECFVDVNFINDTVSFTNRFNSTSCSFGNLKIRKAGFKQVDFCFTDLAIDFTSIAVTHISYLNVYGSVVTHAQIYEDATKRTNEFAAKNEIGIPDLLKRALKRDGWICRQTIIWHKPSPMPESVTDRCTKAHEYIFLLSKSERYYYDADAIKTDSKDFKDDFRRIGKQTWDNKNTPDQLRNGIRPRSTFGNRNGQLDRLHSGNDYYGLEKANKRSVWTVNTTAFKEAHFATFPPELITDCIKAGCPVGGTVVDPFMGAGTTAMVAKKLDRNFIGFELNPEYIRIAEKRLKSELGLFL